MIKETDESYNREELIEFASKGLQIDSKKADQVKEELRLKGVPEDEINEIIVIATNHEIEEEEEEEKIDANKQAEKDMMFGALWFFGGIIATVAEIGYIFWGAILFGGIQFIKGILNYKSKNEAE